MRARADDIKGALFQCIYWPAANIRYVSITRGRDESNKEKDIRSWSLAASINRKNLYFVGRPSDKERL